MKKEQKKLKKPFNLHKSIFPPLLPSISPKIPSTSVSTSPSSPPIPNLSTHPYIISIYKKESVDGIHPSPFSPTTDCRTSTPTPVKNTTTITTAATTKNLVAHRLQFPSPSSRSTQGSACATLPLLQRILCFGVLLCTLCLCILLNISLYIPPPTF